MKPSKAARFRIERSDSLWRHAVFPAVDAFANRYCRLKVHGIRHVPAKGPVVFVPNHGGWFPLDAFIIALALYRRFGMSRVPIGLMHDIAFSVPGLGMWFKKLGCLPVTAAKDPNKLSRMHDVFGIFPEGADGNCKSLRQAYRVQLFRSGFVRLALAMRAKVIPVSSIGGDECLPVLTTIKALKPLLGSVAPLPLSLLPLPVHWDIRFHKPIDFSHFATRLASDRQFCHEMAEYVQLKVQAGIQKSLQERHHRNGHN